MARAFQSDDFPGEQCATKSQNQLDCQIDNAVSLGFNPHQNKPVAPVRAETGRGTKMPDHSMVEPPLTDDPAAVETMTEAINHRTVVGRHRRASTRARIVEAAMRVYAEKGPDAPVIDDFVKAAGMSRGTFYNHFTTTSELLEATIECYANELAQAIVEATEQFDDVIEKAAVAMRSHLLWVTSDPRVCAFFARVPQVGEVGRRAARNQFRQGIATGAFEAPDLDAVCDLVFGTVSETVRRVARSPGKPKRCNEVVATVLAGLGVPPDKIQRVMALPLPSLRLPLRSK